MIKKLLSILSLLVIPAITLANGVSFNIPNPLKASSFEQLARDVLDAVIQFGIPVLVVMIIYTGFKFVSAQGNESKLTEAKNALLWTFVGSAIVLGAFVILTVIENTVAALR